MFTIGTQFNETIFYSEISNLLLYIMFNIDINEYEYKLNTCFFFKYIT